MGSYVVKGLTGKNQNLQPGKRHGNVKSAIYMRGNSMYIAVTIVGGSTCRKGGLGSFVPDPLVRPELRSVLFPFFTWRVVCTSRQSCHSHAVTANASRKDMGQ